MKKIIIFLIGILISISTFPQESPSNKFNGHWTGLYLGINGFQQIDNNLMNINQQKSVNVKLNFTEFNWKLTNNLGVVSGLGFEWCNYRFEKNLNTNLEVNLNENYKKSKLVVNYLNLPLFLEYQTNPYNNLNSFHILGGMNLGWKIGGHTKIKYEDGEKEKTKFRKNIEDFKYEIVGGIGWGKVDVYGTYSLNNLFPSIVCAPERDNLKPFTISVTLKLSKDKKLEDKSLKKEQNCEKNSSNGSALEMYDNCCYWVDYLKTVVDKENQSSQN